MEGTCTALNILQASHISLLPNNLFSMQPHFARTRYHRTRSLSAVISPNEEGDRLPGEREDGRKRGLRGEAIFEPLFAFTDMQSVMRKDL